MGMVVLVGVALGGHHLRQRENAAALLERASRLLRAPIEEVGEIERLQGPLAAQLIEEAERLHPSTQSRLLRHVARGLELMQQRDYLAAEGEFMAGHQLAPQDVDLRVMLSAVWLASNNIVEATQQLAALQDMAPDHPRVLMLTADLALENGAPDQALAIVERAIADHPKAAVLLNRRGLIHERLGAFDRALNDFTLAAATDVHMPEAHLNRGRVLRDDGEFRLAEQAFSQALERNATDPNAWMGRGLCRLQQGQMPEAELDLIRARDLAPGTRDPLVALSDFYAASGDTSQAIELLRASLLIDDKDAVAWLKLGNSLMRTREFRDAVASYRKAASIDDKLSAAHNGLGAALSLLGDHDGARAQLARAAELDHGDPNPLLNLARLAERLGDRRAAEEAWRAALDRDPNAPVPLFVKRSAGT